MTHLPHCYAHAMQSIHSREGVMWALRRGLEELKNSCILLFSKVHSHAPQSLNVPYLPALEAIIALCAISSSNFYSL